jgi:hypothetical protein
VYWDLHWVLDEAAQQQVLTLPPGAFNYNRPGRVGPRAPAPARLQRARPPEPLVVPLERGDELVHPLTLGRDPQHNRMVPPIRRGRGAAGPRAPGAALALWLLAAAYGAVLATARLAPGRSDLRAAPGQPAVRAAGGGEIGLWIVACAETPRKHDLVALAAPELAPDRSLPDPRRQ